MRISARWPRLLALALIAAGSLEADAQIIRVPGVGTRGQGAGMALTNLDADPRPEMILMAYDNPTEMNNFRYRVGWNLDANGVTNRWDNYRTLPGVGWEGQGAGLSVTNLDANARPELIVMAYDNPPRTNAFRYRICWNMSAVGAVQSCDSRFQVAPGVGSEAQGASLLVTNLDRNDEPDMIVVAYDSRPGWNRFLYRIGWDLDSRGRTTDWSSSIEVQGVGTQGQGAGIALANLDQDDRPELLLMAYDNPATANVFRFRRGWNLGENGRAVRWDSYFHQVGGVGWEGDGAEVALFNLDGNSRPELILMAYDDMSGNNWNEFRYRVLRDFGASERIRLEMDKLTGVAYPAAQWRGGRFNTLASIFASAGIQLQQVQDDASLTDIRNGSPYRNADLFSLMDQNMDSPPSSSAEIHMYGLFVTRDVSNNLGIMFDVGDRQGFAVFENAFRSGNSMNWGDYLRTTAHELGHGLCLLHQLGDAQGPSGPMAGQGRTIMNQTADIATDWDYSWSARSLHVLYERPVRQWRPDNGFDFGDCHW